MSDAALWPAHGSGAGTVNVRGAECVGGQPAKRASTNQAIVPGWIVAVSDVAPSVEPTSCAAPPSTEIQTREPIAGAVDVHAKLTGEVTVALGAGATSATTPWPAQF